VAAGRDARLSHWGDRAGPGYGPVTAGLRTGDGAVRGLTDRFGPGDLRGFISVLVCVRPGLQGEPGRCVCRLFKAPPPATVPA